MLKFYTKKVGIKVNLRLNGLAEMVDSGMRIADIGTDHAYLPIKLVENGKINFAIASDIAQGPLENAKHDIKKAGLEKQIETRLGPGLTTVTAADKVDTVIIAGMGGKLITKILSDAWQNNLRVQTLILEPNIGEANVRQWLMSHSYKIIAESIIEEAGHIYELIKAVKSTVNVNLSPEQLYFGPFLLTEKNFTFKQKWRGQLIYQQKLLANLNKAKCKDLVHIQQVEREIKMIKGVLDDES